MKSTRVGHGNVNCASGTPDALFARRIDHTVQHNSSKKIVPVSYV